LLPAAGCLTWAENVENCLVSFLLPQWVQSRPALESACSKNSVIFPQSEHLYSKIGIVKKSKNQKSKLRNGLWPTVFQYQKPNSISSNAVEARER
jgi:hypothetical protein